MDNIEAVIASYGLTEDQYSSALNDIVNKLNNENDYTWEDIIDKYDLDISPCTLRKANGTIFGGKFVYDYLMSRGIDCDYDVKLAELKKEKQKIQALNIERNRMDRSFNRQELFYEYIGSMINTIPYPDFKPLFKGQDEEMEYILCLADLHIGSKFKSTNNEYSPIIAKDRFEFLLGEVIDFVKDKRLSHINILELGDTIAGILRVNDIKLNDSTVVQSVVEAVHLISSFLNELSAYVKIDYYHVPYANHSQLRYLNTKANELASEDMEYIIGNYIHDLLVNNDRITVHLAKENEQYIMLDLFGNKICAMHGHTIKNLNQALKNISVLTQTFINTLIIGHQHGGKTLVSHELGNADAEILVASAFCGSDLYADTLSVGAKAACNIYGFSDIGCCTETKKIILN